VSRSAPEADDGSRAPVLELRDVAAGYGQFGALFGVSLAIPPGQALALIGHNGMGKTTVARVASGLIAPTSGQVLVDGVDMTERGAHELARAGVAHAPEGPSVFATLTVEENCTIPFRRQLGRKGVAPALDRVFSLFPRLGERRRQAAGSLSGGEQRMLILARSMVLEPRLLIADELSLGLAPIITDEVYRVLGDILDAGTALLIIEQHTQHALALAHQAAVLDRGTIALSGACDEVAAHHQALAASTSDH
jgi:branched-chain amino acid transport system ATP-binding protein